MRGENERRPVKKYTGPLPDIRSSGDGSLIRIRVQPRSSKNAIVGVHASAVKIKVTPPPEGGRANVACLKLLAGALSIPRSSLEIIRGGRERDKVVLAAGLSTGEARMKLARLLSRLRD